MADGSKSSEHQSKLKKRGKKGDDAAGKATKKQKKEKEWAPSPAWQAWNWFGISCVYILLSN